MSANSRDADDECRKAETEWNKAQKGDKTTHLYNTIGHYANALKWYSEQSNSRKWADIQLNLARAHGMLGQGSLAIKRCEKALTVYQPMSKEWGETQCTLANAYYISKGSINVENAISGFQQALLCFPEGECPRERARILAGLAVAYRNRIEGEFDDNLDEAINLNEQILEMIKLSASCSEDSKNHRASTLHNLANCYQDQDSSRGLKGESIKKAINCYKDALDLYRDLKLPLDWAETSQCLANAYMNKNTGLKAKDVDKAVKKYKEVLDVFKKHGTRIQTAMTLRSLGGAYVNRINGEKKDNFSIAKDYYRQALEYLKNDVGERAQVYLDLARILRHLVPYLDDLKLKLEFLEEAISRCEEADKIFTPDINGKEYVKNLTLLSNCYFDLAHIVDPQQRCTLFEQALEASTNAVEIFYGHRAVIAAGSDDFTSKESLAADFEQAFGLQMACYLALGQFVKALELADCSHSRCLVDLAHIPSLDAAAALHYDSSHVSNYAEWCDVKRELGRLQRERETMERTAGLPGRFYNDRLRIVRQRIAQTSAKEQALRSAIMDSDPTFLPAERLSPLSFDDMKKALGRSTVALVWFSLGQCAGVMLAYNSGDQCSPKLLLEYCADDLRKIRLAAKELFQSVSVSDSKQDSIEAVKVTFTNLAQALRMSEVGSKLTEKNTEPGKKYDFASYSELVIVAQGIFQNLPLSAMPLGRQPYDSERYLSDMISTFYCPSLGLLNAARGRKPGSLILSAKAFVAVQNPTSDLPATDQEVQDLVERLPKVDQGDSKAQMTVLSHDAATDQAVRLAVAERARGESSFVLHFSCHGSFVEDRRWESRLVLAGKTKLTASDIMDLPLYRCHLCVLAACSSGLTAVAQSEQGEVTEPVGLATAVLVAGAVRCVATLWQVSDTACALFMNYLYSHLIHSSGQESLTSAVRKAQLQLRRLSYGEVKRMLKTSNRLDSLSELGDRFRVIADTIRCSPPRDEVVWVYRGPGSIGAETDSDSERKLAAEMLRRLKNQRKAEGDDDNEAAQLSGQSRAGVGRIRQFSEQDWLHLVAALRAKSVRFLFSHLFVFMNSGEPLAERDFWLEYDTPQQSGAVTVAVAVLHVHMLRSWDDLDEKLVKQVGFL
jgi:CHAT domain-containing protein